MATDLASPRFRGDAILEACLDGGHRMLAPEEGPAVASVQRALVDLGFLPSYRDADGKFGPITGAAVSTFKQGRGLSPADMVVGQGTMAALDALFPARLLNPGNFAAFVGGQRLDNDVADLLNELEGFPADSWARQIAGFVHHELTAGNLVGIVRVANAAKIQPRIPASFHPKLLQLVAGAAGFNAVTEPVEVNPNQFLGYTLVNDALLDRTHPGGPDHGFGFLILAHEMTHFRNRDFFVALDRSSVAERPDLYVDPVSAAALPGTPRVASIFMQELMCDHVAWRVKQDMDRRNGRTPPVLGPGQLYRFALTLAAGTFDNGYRAGLSAADANRQVAVWLWAAGQRLFHDDPAKNAEVRLLFEGEFALAQPSFATPTVPQAGGE